MSVLDGDDERGEIQGHESCGQLQGAIRKLQGPSARIVSATWDFSDLALTLLIRSYGELGYLIIHQTIYQLFPPDTIDPHSTTPLTPGDFVQRILVPEAAVHLIMEDLHSTYPSAIKTLRESAEYGVAMFPDTGADNEEGTKAADDVVKERARARRKQLLEEEVEIQQHDSSEMEVELEILRSSSPPKPTTPKKRRNKQAKSGAKFLADTKESERDSEMIDLCGPRTPTHQPPTVKSRRPASGYRSDASNASNSSLASRASTRSMTRKQTPKVGARTTQASDPPLPLPASQPPKQQESASSYRAKTPSDRSSDVEVISDPSTRNTRKHALDGTKSAPQPHAKNSKSTGKRPTGSARAKSTSETDSDDELLNSSPFNVGRHVSRRTLSTELRDLDMDETPKPQKITSMKLNPDPWRVSTVSWNLLLAFPTLISDSASHSHAVREAAAHKTCHTWWRGIKILHTARLPKPYSRP